MEHFWEQIGRKCVPQRNRMTLALNGGRKVTGCRWADYSGGRLMITSLLQVRQMEGGGAVGGHLVDLHAAR